MPDHFVYIIAQCKNEQAIAPCKIGVAVSPRSRMRELQTAAPFKLILHSQIATPNREIALYLERAFHEVQRKKRLYGEWFDMMPGYARGLMAINLMVALKINAPGLTEEEFNLAFEMSMGEKLAR